MGKVLSIVLGALTALVGFILLISWWGWFLRGLMALVPVMLIFGGIIALIAGISEVKDAIQSKSETKDKK
jgi:hypothetical protein